MQLQNKRDTMARTSKPTPEHPPLANKSLIDQTHRQTIERELELINISQEIGTIAERNCAYTLSLTLKINQPIKSLTVAQLLAFYRECVKHFNQWEV